VGADVSGDFWLEVIVSGDPPLTRRSKLTDIRSKAMLSGSDHRQELLVHSSQFLRKWAYVNERTLTTGLALCDQPLAMKLASRLAEVDTIADQNKADRQHALAE
jgi:hypothetical protein